jgi:hypothetical protein
MPHRIEASPDEINAVAAGHGIPGRDLARALATLNRRPGVPPPAGPTRRPTANVYSAMAAIAIGIDAEFSGADYVDDVHTHGDWGIAAHGTAVWTLLLPGGDRLTLTLAVEDSPVCYLRDDGRCDGPATIGPDYQSYPGHEAVALCPRHRTEGPQT